MKKMYLEELANTAKAIDQEARLSTLDELDKKLLKQYRLYRQVLFSDEAMNIYFHSHGIRHAKLNELRKMLEIKRIFLDKMSNMIWEMEHKVITNNK